MVQATCKYCGTVHEFEEHDVPPSGKVVKCKSCTKPVTVMPGASSADQQFGTGNMLGDLPMPKRSSGLGAAKAGAAPKKPERRSALADAIDLPAPKAAGLSDLPAPKAAGLSDLPAPKAAGLSDLPAPKAAGLSDLPAPKAAGLSDLPAPKAAGLADLPAPKGAPSLGDLPAPKGPPGLGDLPAPKGPPGLGDLPAPKGPPSLGNLPAPKAPPKIPNLPGPKTPGLADLPAPKSSPGLSDLPRPVGAQPTKQLPDLLAPVDSGIADLPAPKLGDEMGLAPVGPELAPTAALDLDALDLAPAASKPPKRLIETQSDVEPEPVPAAAATVPLDLGEPLDLGGAGESLSLEGGLDLGPPQGGLDLGPSDGPGLDLGEPLDLGPAAEPLSLGDSLELGPSSEALSLGDAGPASDALDLDGMELASPSAGNSDWGEVELPSPGGETKAPSTGGVVSFSKAPALKKPKAAVAVAKNDALELDLSPVEGPAPTAKKAARPKKKVASSEGEEKKPKSRKKTVVSAAAVVGVLALGGGGYFGFTKWQESKELGELVDKGTATARKELSSSAKGHWLKAAKAAEKVLKADKKNGEALAFAAQARLARGFELGSKKDIAAGKKWAKQLSTSKAKGAEAAKAAGLKLLADNQAAKAAKKLSGLAKKRKKDRNLFLYLGWAEQAHFRFPQAAKAFATASKLAPKRVSAHLGQGIALMALGDVEKSKAAFEKIIALDKNHFGARVGLAWLSSEKGAAGREKRVLELLALEEAKKADPRQVAMAWSMAADAALALGRVGEAGDRYAKASKLDPGNLDAVVGQARVDLAEKRFDNATALIERARKLAPAHVLAQLTHAEILLAGEQPDEALKVIEPLLENEGRLSSKNDRMRAHMVRGTIYSKDPDSHALAEADFKAAIENSTPGEVGGQVALARLYTITKREAEALELLKPVEDAARSDAGLAVTLGVAYLGAKNPEKAITWFETALEQRPDDLEAKFQLGQAKLAAGDGPGGLSTIGEAYKSSNKREDIGLRLALAYESLGQDPEAYKIYEELLKGEPSINLRERAGRFFARTGDVKRASALGDSILADSENNPAGLYLKGEALFANKKYGEALELFEGAVRNDSQPQFLEGKGRAMEGLERFEPALKAYAEAIEKAPKYLPPRVGRLRILTRTRRYRAALEDAREAIRAFPEVALLHYYRGDAFLGIRDQGKAIEALKVAVKMDRNLAAARHGLGIAYHRSGRSREAARELATATRLAKGEERWLLESYRVLGYAMRDVGNRSAARAAWRSYLDRAPQTGDEYREVKRLLLRLEAR